MRSALLLAVAFLSHLALADGYRTDARLTKPVSMRLKIAPLSAWVKQLSRDTGVGIYVANSIAERKVTAIFTDKPAAQAMEMLEKTFFCRWTSEAGGYRLEMPREAQNEESSLLLAEQAVMKERIAAVVQKLSAIAERPQEELIEERDRMREQLDRLRLAQDAATKKQYEAMRKDYGRFDGLGNWDIGFALRAAPTAADTLAGGGTLFASTTRGEALPLPVTSIPTFVSNVMIPSPDGPPKFERRSPTGAIAALHYNPITGNLDCRIFGTGLGPFGGGYTTRPLANLNSGEAEAKLANLPLRKRLRTWAASEDTALLDLKITPPREASPSPGYLAKAFSMAEHLEYLADAAGVAVMSDAFRLPASYEEYMAAPTVGEYVRSLLSKTLPDARGGYFRAEHGWLLFKHPRYWRQLEAEIPEGVYAPMEKRADHLILDDYANFAAVLTPLQASTFPYRPALTRFPRLPLVQGLPGLRLWGSLSRDQRQAAYGMGLPFAAMNSSQRELYRSAAMELLWLTGLNETFLPVLMHGVESVDQLGFFLRDAGNGAEPVFGSAREAITPADPQVQTVADLKELKSRAVSFIFGSAPLPGAAYNVILPAQSK